MFAESGSNGFYHPILGQTDNPGNEVYPVSGIIR